MRTALPAPRRCDRDRGTRGDCRRRAVEPRLRSRQRGVVPTADRVQLVGASLRRPAARRAAGRRTRAPVERQPVRMAAEARRLAARGIWVFAFDFRGHGFSKGRVKYGRLATDYAAAVKAVRSLGAQERRARGRIARRDRRGRRRAPRSRPPVDGVAALSAPAVIAGRVDARPFAPRLAVPALFVAARERPVPAVRLRRRRAAALRRDGRDGEAARAGRRLGPRGRARRKRSPAIRALLERFVRDPRRPSAADLPTRAKPDAARRP